ncbi:bifunctional riboflavin kinase/FAD synthetase [Paenibacillus sp. sptzw28]|uniref:bifunctional riboflavin kinase/FAD synthetase n=1 Tax=Paenibacillus sp. sptzw28 TaxID=715179 RepID=UPI001C6F17C3|nr:bifunctional riboflavin kinase/FAD synthetase [Paenibacillus sp. sptzw28]QYR19728.1 bifunctional riboflavin kinase/FAD synthetase [Paenibacillus sp. sptzw28]
MEIISLQYPVLLSDAARSAQPKTLAIGHFDGVHKGHQNVIRRSVEAAGSAGIQSAVMTFDPHPKEVLGQGQQYLSCLTPLREKVERFRGLGVDIVYIVKFDLNFSVVTPGEFVQLVLRPLQVKKAIVGFDFTFGARGAGKPDTLKMLGAPDVEVEVVEPLMLNGSKVSSTNVREALAEGRPEAAEQLLGTPYQVRGTVVHGEGRGKTLGFPTANLEPESAYVIPRQGVYAIMADVDGERIPGVLNIGVKPTFHEQLPKPVLEAHLLDYNGDLYGKPVIIRFISYIRAEKKFNSLDELIGQIRSDADLARSILSAFK